MILDTIEAGNRLANGPGLGGGKSFPATSASEPTPAALGLQVRKLCDRFGFTPESALVTAELAFTMTRGRQ